jgi:tRNA pseudouridine38-40 synthase
MAERNIRLLIQYEGTAYNGWQIQTNADTIQGRLSDAIFKTTKTEVNLLGAGRTDAGVHALGQVANFRIDHRLEPDRYADALNYYLPQDIRVTRSEEVPHEFHSRYHATARRYRYLMSSELSAVARNHRHHHRPAIDPDRLRAAAELVVGVHDFSAFCVAASRKEDNTCDITHSRWRAVGPLWVYEVSGNRFLHSMVRSLVGGMLNLAAVKQDQNRLNLTLDTFSDIITAPGEERMPFTAPACGLYLVKVSY